MRRRVLHSPAQWLPVPIYSTVRRDRISRTTIKSRVGVTCIQNDCRIIGFRSRSFYIPRITRSHEVLMFKRYMTLYKPRFMFLTTAIYLDITRSSRAIWLTFGNVFFYCAWMIKFLCHEKLCAEYAVWFVNYFLLSFFSRLY